MVSTKVIAMLRLQIPRQHVGLYQSLQLQHQVAEGKSENYSNDDNRSAHARGKPAATKLRIASINHHHREARNTARMLLRSKGVAASSRDLATPKTHLTGWSKRCTKLFRRRDLSRSVLVDPRPTRGSGAQMTRASRALRASEAARRKAALHSGLSGVKAAIVKTFDRPEEPDRSHAPSHRADARRQGEMDGHLPLKVPSTA